MRKESEYIRLYVYETKETKDMKKKGKYIGREVLLICVSSDQGLSSF